MDRRRFLLTSLAGALAASFGDGAQAAERVWRVGILWGIRPGPEWTAGGAFFGPMRELGWIEGQNIVFEQRHANEQPELLPMLAREQFFVDRSSPLLWDPIVEHYRPRSHRPPAIHSRTDYGA